GGKDASAAKLGELHGHGSDSPGSAMNDDAFAFLQVQRVVDALKRGETGNRHRARALQIKRFGNVRDIFDGDGNVFGIEAAPGIQPTVRIDAIAQLKSAHSRSNRGDRAGSIRPKDEREARLARRPPAATHIAI